MKWLKCRIIINRKDSWYELVFSTSVINLRCAIAIKSDKIWMFHWFGPLLALFLVLSQSEEEELCQMRRLRGRCQNHVTPLSHLEEADMRPRGRPQLWIQGGQRGHGPPVPVKTSHKNYGGHRRPLIFHVSCPPTPTPSDHAGSDAGPTLLSYPYPSASSSLLPLGLFSACCF